jgi:hypothetical protein
MAALKEAVPVTPAQAVMHSSVLRSNALAAQRKATLEAIRAFDHPSEPICRLHADYHLLAARPGAGTVYAARLTAAMGTDRDRGATADALLCCSGVAPVMARRGQSTWSRWRYGCPKSLRQSFHE